MITSVTISLEDLRNGRFYETRAEFAKRLGITEQTYRRLLEAASQVQNPTKRQIAARLGLPPHLIHELLPVPTAARLTALTAVIDDADAAHSWMELGEDGSLITAPDVQCGPGEGI